MPSDFNIPELLNFERFGYEFATFTTTLSERLKMIQAYFRARQKLNADADLMYPYAKESGVSHPKHVSLRNYLGHENQQSQHSSPKEQHVQKHNKDGKKPELDMRGGIYTDDLEGDDITVIGDYDINPWSGEDEYFRKRSRFLKALSNYEETQRLWWLRFHSSRARSDPTRDQHPDARFKLLTMDYLKALAAGEVQTYHSHPIYGKYATWTELQISDCVDNTHFFLRSGGMKCILWHFTVEREMYTTGLRLKRFQAMEELRLTREGRQGDSDSDSDVEMDDDEESDEDEDDDGDEDEDEDLEEYSEDSAAYTASG
ncbi:hypothetical protein DFH27DRAFT_558170 [Peziza echinospora]|nr:hypothetical protein DFH27DRAFT_558170 [Peziza echinospora]